MKQATNYKGFIIDDTGKSNGSFMMQDIYNLVCHLKIMNPVIEIVNYDAGNEEEKISIFKEIFEKYKGCIILTTNYISTKEFQEAEYNDPFDKCKDPNKKDIDVEFVTERNRKLLERLGFVDINFYVQYEFKTAYLLNNNESAKEILKHLKEK